MKCTHTDCNREARYAPKIYVPPTGWPALPRHSIALICGLPFCGEHVIALKPDELVPDLAKLAQLAINMKGSHIPPDMERAFVAPLRLDSEEYRQFEKFGAAHNTRTKPP